MTDSSTSASTSSFWTFRVKRPFSIRVKMRSSSTIFVSRLASFWMTCRPFWASASRFSSYSSVSLQPLMAVRGVRSSWDTEEMNSVCIFSASPILADISLMESTSSPTSSR